MAASSSSSSSSYLRQRPSGFTLPERQPSSGSLSDRFNATRFDRSSTDYHLKAPEYRLGDRIPERPREANDLRQRSPSDLKFDRSELRLRNHEIKFPDRDFSSAREFKAERDLRLGDRYSTDLGRHSPDKTPDRLNREFKIPDRKTPDFDRKISEYKLNLSDRKTPELDRNLSEYKLGVADRRSSEYDRLSTDSFGGRKTPDLDRKFKEYKEGERRSPDVDRRGLYDRSSPDVRSSDKLTSSYDLDRNYSSNRLKFLDGQQKDAGVFTRHVQEPTGRRHDQDTKRGSILEETKRGSIFEEILEKQKKSARDTPDSPAAKTRPTSGGRDLRSVTQTDRDKDKKKPARKRKQPVTANLSGTRYEIVRYCAEKSGFVIAHEDDMNSFLTWVDSYASTDRVAELKSYQRINHFPNMGEICRKDALSRNMCKMAKEQPEEYSFTPRTWTFPSEYNTFMQYARELKKKKKVKTFIVKPANGAMGNGIQLYRNPEKIPGSDQTIVQEYVDKPFLIDGYKCDLRIYVLVTACDPLRVFLFHDGLLRLGTEKYILPTDSNIDSLYMHLTNYSINKHSETYEKVDSVSSGSKRSLKFLNEYLRKNDYDVSFLWRNIVDIIVKTLVVAQPHVLHAYRMCRPGQPVGSDSVCFEILGFDILLDRKLKPWLLEVNRSPSFGTDEKIDHQIKSALLNDTFKLLNIKASDRRKNMAAQKADAQKRLFRHVKRVDTNTSEAAKRRQQIERRKEELKDLLVRVRRDATREEFENRNCGRFQRIFPPDDKFRQEKYTQLLSVAFSIFLSNRSGTLQREIELTYNNKLKEVDILDMLAQYETDENKTSVQGGTPGRKGPPLSGVRKPLTSLPQSQPDEAMSTDSEDESGRSKARPSRTLSRSQSFKTLPADNKNSGAKLSARSKSLPRPPENVLTSTPLDRETELIKKTLIALNEMRIRFPGKTNEEADLILDKIHENWKYHKPRVASYWLVKLDSVKRRKVIDIVRSNVRSGVQRVWSTSDVDSLKLTRTFGRVFNRLLWSHGQGLWNCFTTSGTSWETIFSKSSDVISTLELNCCRRIVQLCKDCLLIVYQFASDAKAGAHYVADEETQRFGVKRLGGSVQKME